MKLLHYLLTGLSAFIWLTILLLPWRPWRNDQVLELENPNGDIDLEDVTVVIPARNEAPVIGTTMSALAQQGSNLHVILVDDCSTDGTAEQACQESDLDLRILSGKPLPEGWAGKLWALEQGVSQVNSKYTLLLDADIALAPGVITALITTLKRKQCQFVSVMASLHMRSFWEKLLIPAFIYFYKLIYPFGLANSPDKRFASAAGGCILLETNLFNAIGGLQTIRGALIDDCTLASHVKRAGFRTWTGQSRAVWCVRPYAGLGEIWNMVARSAYTQLRYSVIILLLCSFFLITMFWIPVFGLFSSITLIRVFGLLAWIGMMATYLPTLVFYEQNLAWALLMPLGATLYLGMTWSSALHYWGGERSRWKGRVY